VEINGDLVSIGCTGLVWWPGSTGLVWWLGSSPKRQTFTERTPPPCQKPLVIVFNKHEHLTCYENNTLILNNIGQKNKSVN
jgi:hypothetical protein